MNSRSIKKLDSEILMEMGWKFAGVYWEHPYIQFKLMKEGDTYVTYFEGVTDQKKISIGTNAFLLNIMIRYYWNFLKDYLKEVGNNITSADDVEKIFEDSIRKYFKFTDEKYQLKVIPIGGSQDIIPRNEFTYILYNGYESEFEIVYSKFNESHPIKKHIFTHPNIISLDYIEKELNLEPGDEVQEVYIINDTAKRFFGVGVNYV